MNIDFALVTGAGRGIGRSLARAIATAGVPVVCISRTSTCVATARSIVDAGGRAEGVMLDIANFQACEKTVSQTVCRYRPTRMGVVLAAAVLGTPGGLINGPPLADWGAVYCTNALGNLAVLRGCLPRMRETGFGRVIALAGGGASYAYPEFSAYALSKTAIVRAMENADAELHSLGDFSFVALAPGAVETDMLAKVRAAGGTVRTTTSVDEAVAFVSRFFSEDVRALSGRFVHVRDEWEQYLGPTADALPPHRWKLRRSE